MARPTKKTVDYFPHVVVHGKTMYIIEEMFGNDGYAFWYKLLELLGASPGHFYDCNKQSAWMFLLSRTRTDGETAIKILETLSELEAIDQELWVKRIIWSDKFVEGIRDAYSRRMDSLPTRERLCQQLFGFCEHQQGKIGVSDDNNVREETKPNQTKPQKSKTEAQTDCPHAAIIKLYHEILPTLPRVQEWTHKRQNMLRTRWKERPDRQTIDWWRAFFTKVSQSSFLMGHRAEFRADLEWLITASNFVKVLEGRYHDEGRGAAPRSTEETSGSKKSSRNTGDGQCFPVDTCVTGHS